ncbi:MAG: hypothetical protein LBC53_09450 [Spirochaetaceae bacterium]|jgi:hypothetical protein|nr:hypothetical protein [Spirochaetaceae bacterium]
MRRDALNVSREIISQGGFGGGAPSGNQDEKPAPVGRKPPPLESASDWSGNFADRESGVRNFSGKRGFLPRSGEKCALIDFFN